MTVMLLFPAAVTCMLQGVRMGNAVFQKLPEALKEQQLASLNVSQALSARADALRLLTAVAASSTCC